MKPSWMKSFVIASSGCRPPVPTILAVCAGVVAGLTACSPGGGEGSADRSPPDDPSADASRDASAALSIGAGEPFQDVSEEGHLRNVRQLTFDGENAEAYFSFDGSMLVYQRTPPEGGCDQIYTLDLATGETTLISTGEGRTTCAYYYPEGDRILYSSTHHVSDACPAPPDYSQGYVWPVHEEYDVFLTDPAGSEHVQLTETPGYDAEATISPVGDRIVFTSARDGDLELYSMGLDGTDVRRLTHSVGYDGGAFFSPDGSRIVWRSHYPASEEAKRDYRRLLDQGLIRPTALEIRVMNADGTGVRQVTDNGAANFAPYWHPAGGRILFASNMEDPAGRDFDIYVIGVDGSGLERITWTADFDGFPVFSPDGRWLVWASNRNAAHEGNTNIFIAEWVEDPGAGPSGS